MFRPADSRGFLRARTLVLAALASSAGCDSPTPPAPVSAVPSASAAALASVPPLQPRPKKRYSVAVIGDSLTDEKSRGGGYLRYAAERCPQSRFDNYGKGGDMLTHIRMRYRRDLFGTGLAKASPKPKYDHLVLFAGVNDLYSNGRNPKSIDQDMLGIYRAAHEHGMKVVAITVAPWGGFRRYFTPKRGAATRELNAMIRARRASGDVDHVIDAFSLLGCGDGDKLCPELAAPFKDGIHFGPKGHERLGKALHDGVFADCR